LGSERSSAQRLVDLIADMADEPSSVTVKPRNATTSFYVRIDGVRAPRREAMFHGAVREERLPVGWQGSDAGKMPRRRWAASVPASEVAANVLDAVAAVAGIPRAALEVSISRKYIDRTNIDEYGCVSMASAFVVAVVAAVATAAVALLVGHRPPEAADAPHLVVPTVIDRSFVGAIAGLGSAWMLLSLWETRISALPARQRTLEFKRMLLLAVAAAGVVPILVILLPW
jgi:hypothetical protein